MSVFRNNPNPRPGDKTDLPNRFGESPARADTSNDLLSREAPAAEAERPAPAPASAYPSFGERETRLMPTEMDKCANVIAAGSKWNGSLNIDDSVRIEGHLSGEVVAKGTVHIAEGARVEAKIRAAFVVISGTFKGEVRCSERLELLPKSRVEGELVTKVLNVHEGALLDGTIQMQNEKPEASPAPSRSRNVNGSNGSVPVEASAGL